MDYLELEPPPALLGRVTFWRLSSAASAASAPPEPIVPDGCVELIVHLGDPFVVEQDGERVRQPRALVAGPGTRPVRLAPGGRSDVVGLRVAAGFARAFVDGPLDALTDRLPPMEDVAPGFARGLGEELSEPRSDERWTDVLARRALACFARGPSTPTAAARAAARLRACRGRLDVARLAGELGLSTRQLERGFAEHVGLPPRAYARILRFQGALAQLRGSRSTLAEVAARCGYFDQAHLVRDCQRFAGTSPGRLRAAEPELTGHFAAG